MIYLIVYACIFVLSFLVMLTYIGITDPMVDEPDRIGSSFVFSLAWPITLTVFTLHKLSDILVEFIRSRK